MCMSSSRLVCSAATSLWSCAQVDIGCPACVYGKNPLPLNRVRVILTRRRLYSGCLRHGKRLLESGAGNLHAVADIPSGLRFL